MINEETLDIEDVECDGPLQASLEEIPSSFAKMVICIPPQTPSKFIKSIAEALGGVLSFQLLKDGSITATIIRRNLERPVDKRTRVLIARQVPPNCQIQFYGVEKYPHAQELGAIEAEMARRGPGQVQGLRDRIKNIFAEENPLPPIPPLPPTAAQEKAQERFDN